MGKLGTLIPTRMDIRFAGDTQEWVRLEFHEKEDQVDLVFLRSQIPFLIEQLEKVKTAAPERQ